MTLPSLLHLRIGAAAAALVLAVLARGDVVVLAGALALMTWRPVALVVVPAVLAVAWRWGSTDLEAIVGAQSVLGPAITVGPPAAAVAAGSAGAAVLLAVARPARGERGHAPPRLLVAAATGAAVAVLVAGPGPGGDVWQRGVAGVVVAVAALGIGPLRSRRAGFVLDVAGAVAAVAAVIVASLDAPGWAGTVDGGAAVEGLVIAAAVLAVVVVGSAAMGHRRA